jgi:hypothetical protein
MGIWTGAFFLSQSQSPRLVSLLDTHAKASDPSAHSMQQAFLMMGSAGLVVGFIALALLVFRPKRAAV